MNNNQHCLIALSKGMISARSPSGEAILTTVSSVVSFVSLLKRTELSKSSTLTNHDLYGLWRWSSRTTNVLHLPDGADDHRQSGFQGEEREICMTFGSETGLHCLPAYAVTSDVSLSLSGSNQAREGRLVDALAVRGDERRDTLR